MQRYPYLLPTIEFSALKDVTSTLSLIDNEVVDTGIMPGPEVGFTIFTSKPVPPEGQKKLHLKPFE